MSSERVKVRLFATAEIQVPLDTEVNLDEFREWYEESGGTLAEVEPDDIVEFINASPDDQYEFSAQFPKPDVDVHELLTFDIDEAEIL